MLTQKFGSGRRPEGPGDHCGASAQVRQGDADEGRRPSRVPFWGDLAVLVDSLGGRFVIAQPVPPTL
jgi:hypothetical protein